MATAKKTESTKKPHHKVSLPEIPTLDPKTVASLGKNEVSDFVKFIRQQGVVGLAVGLAVGTAAGAAVKSIVDGLINPIVGFLIGGINLVQLTWVIVKPHADGKGGLVLSWGAVLSALITLIATAFVVYLIVHYARLDRLDMAKDS